MPSDRNNPELLGTIIPEDFHTVIGRTTANLDPEDVYSFVVNQSTIIAVDSDLAPASITYTYVKDYMDDPNERPPGYADYVSRLDDRLVNVDFILAKDSNNNGNYDNNDQTLIDIPDGQTATPAVDTLSSGRYFLVFLDDKQSYGGADLPSVYNTKVSFFTAATSNSSPILAIAATSANQTEGNLANKAFTFTVTRSGDSSVVNNVSWSVTGTGTNPADAADFANNVLPTGTVSFAVGDTSKTITVNVMGDTIVEPNESFTVTLSNPTNAATISNATATGTIQDDDNLAPPPPPTNDPLTSPVYRFYNATSRGHFFTTNTAERDTVLANPQWGYSFEGVGFNASTTSGDNLLPLFRFYNADSKGHFFTASTAERDNVLANPQWGYTFEGIGFYAYGADANLASDVFRFYNATSKGHFFTLNATERDTVLANSQWGYTFEGVGFEAKS